MVIHQTLHGYSQGHNRLASSCSLSAQDDERMKMLSDWSEYSGSKDNSYITTYPLSDGKSYVVAKSWYADDMERPGCVWTHSLILDLTELDDKFDFRSLIDLFNRPVKGDYASYSMAIKYAPKTELISCDAYREEELIWLYSNLVNRDVSTPMLFRVEMDSSYYQNLILLMLQYLPLEFLKEIAMCSGSAYGRKHSLVEYNLQFAASARMSLSAIVKESKEEVDCVCEGIKSICRTMMHQGSDTSGALRIFSHDIGNSFQKLCAVGLLMKYLDEAIEQSKYTQPFDVLLKLLAETFPNVNEGQNLKLIFCKRNISNLFSSESIVLFDLATKIPDGLLDFEQMEYSGRVATFKEESGIDEFGKLLQSILDSDKINAAGDNLLKHSTGYLSVADYAYLAQNYWPVYMSLVMANPTVLKYGFWVDLPEERFVAIYDEFKKYCYIDFEAWDRLFAVVLYRNHLINSGLMDGFVKKVPNLTFEVMDYLNTSETYCLDAFLQKAVKRSEVMEWLKTHDVLLMPTVRFLVENVVPTASIIKSYGSDVWSAFGKCDKYESLYYYTYLFILGHNWTDENGLQYLKRSFYPLHRALAADSFPESLWDKLEPYTAKLRLLNEWDKCKKLRKGVVMYLKKSGCKKSILSDYTPDKELNEMLKDVWRKL